MEQHSMDALARAMDYLTSKPKKIMTRGSCVVPPPTPPILAIVINTNNAMTPQISHTCNGMISLCTHVPISEAESPL